MIKNISNLGVVLNTNEQQQIKGGLLEPSDRRCDRLLRRAERYLENNNINGYDRVIATYNRICPTL